MLKIKLLLMPNMQRYVGTYKDSLVAPSRHAGAMTSLSGGGGHLPASEFEKMQMDAGDVVVPDLLSCLTKFSTRRVDSRRSLSAPLPR